ncbi:D-arabinono-1,4-lactone oxidase [Mycobacterium sp. AZCC_0083]|uniref:D-arabinono-1,4-lactone oxidase n=1 Tax=Mycobacterium sp. AZCC_0083 TaxID=2735882 RepID=UPI00160C3166|nr:D-arabinono-1,4-lactone oxidase [Mycobacterium sp. AZCC_0083]MBB5161648.1 FAD/FMN-containing dehydrogenase [Mycobacterium sp. AZCC_0083]
MAGIMRSQWSNWAGNQQCAPQRVLHPSTEADVQDAVTDAANQGLGVRVVGTGHSFSPLSVTDGVILCMDRMTGVTEMDAARHRVRVLAGTTIRQMGDPLWAARLCLKNQGDIDAQQIAGAIGTATHGSGAAQQCFSAMATKFRVVLATGEVREVSTDDPRRLAAARVAMGMLGVVTEVELDVREAFGLAENLEYWPVEQVLERFDDEMAHRRHFSFFWMPYDGSPGSLFMDWPASVGPGDCALVKLYDEVPQSSFSSTPDPGYRRVDRPYRIYPDPDFEGVIVNRELEYFVHYEDGKDAFLALRELILAKYPDQLYPIEVRSIAADDAYLSPFYQRPSISISICGHEDKDYMGFLADVAATLDDFDARPHWGKLNFMTRERIARLFPRLGDFEAVRQELDPQGTFLSPYLSTLFA